MKKPNLKIPQHMKTAQELKKMQKRELVHYCIEREIAFIEEKNNQLDAHRQCLRMIYQESIDSIGCTKCSQPWKEVQRLIARRDK